MKRMPHTDLACALLLEAGALNVSVAEPFTVTSGAKSPVYFDCRTLISHPSAMTVVSGLFQRIIEERRLECDAVAGGESAGIPFAARLAGVLGRPMVYIRKKPRGHGTGSQIEGTLGGDSHVLLVEDMITDGGSKMAFVDALNDAGATVTDCLVVLDREQGGAQSLAKKGVALHSLTTARELLEYAGRTREVSDADAQAVLEYLESN